MSDEPKKINKRLIIIITVLVAAIVIAALTVTLAIIFSKKKPQVEPAIYSLEQIYMPKKGELDMLSRGTYLEKLTSKITSFKTNYGINASITSMLISDGDFFTAFEVDTIEEATSLAQVLATNYGYIHQLSNIVFASEGRYLPQLLLGYLNFSDDCVILTIDNQRVLIDFSGKSYDQALNITSIGYRAFSNAATQTAVIESSVKTIDNEAFFAAEFLAQLSFNNSELIEIGDSAFSYCNKLTTVTLPNLLETIGTDAFSGCANLTSVTFSGNIKNIGGGAFTDCNLLTSINVSNSDYFINESNILYTKGKTAVIKALSISGKLTISNTVKTIEKDAFSKMLKLTEVTANGVTNIKEGAFSNCINLINADVFSAAINIGNNAFINCNKLETLNLGNTIKTIGANAFRNLKIRSVVLPQTVTDIGDNAFDTNTGLRSVSFSGSAPQIGTESFTGVVRLFVPNIENYSYNFNAYLSKLYPSSIITGDWAAQPTEGGAKIIQYLGSNPNVEIPSYINNQKITSIGEHALYSLNFLKTVSFATDSAVNTLGNYCFAANWGLTAVTLPQTITRINAFAFDGNGNLSEVNVPSSVNFVGEKAFQNTAFLKAKLGMYVVGSGSEQWLVNYNGEDKSINIAEGVKTIGYRAFSDNKHITHLTLSSTTQTIYDYAFAGCSSLQSVDLKNVKVIAPLAFAWADGLSQITIPASVEYIGSSAFFKPSLTKVIVEGLKPCNVKSDIFMYPLVKLAVYVPDSAYCNATGEEFCKHSNGRNFCYRHASGWSGFRTSIFPISKMPTNA